MLQIRHDRDEPCQIAHVLREGTAAARQTAAKDPMRELITLARRLALLHKEAIDIDEIRVLLGEGDASQSVAERPQTREAGGAAQGFSGDRKSLLRARRRRRAFGQKRADRLILPIE